MELIHIISPGLYVLFVKMFKYIEPCPEYFFMKLARYHHNISLAALSFIMLVMITIGNYQTNKFDSIHNLLCSSYQDNWYANTGAKMFLWSKYLEWGDTLFLHLSNKPISMLQYTHHMSTAFLMHTNFDEYLSPHMYVFMGSNCFVHIWMYWYFAEPKGWLYPYRECITRIQIVQHILCLYTIYKTYMIGSHSCEQNKYGNFCGALMYSMYLFYFILFYINKYNYTIKDK